VFRRFFHEQAAAGSTLVALTYVVAGFARAFLRNLFDPQSGQEGKEGGWILDRTLSD